MDVPIEIRINWTPNQWRRFLGQADMTPLIELMSIMTDGMALHFVDQRLEALKADHHGMDAGTGSSVLDAASSDRG